MNYVKFNDIDSRTIQGLLISELPPISKPKMRIKETEIDGVDGSFIEELGYETYDKTLVIGLRGKYDIDEVIEYFTGEGTMVFSNEPDKYYKVRIIGQVDYERLLRFKTAKIKMKVQPYKYLYKEPKQEFEKPVGSIILVNNGLETSKPIIHIIGSGTIEFKMEDITIFSYTFPEGDTEVTIDSEKQDAYLGTELKNRNMTGEFPTLKVGKNNITWSGAITSIEVTPNSRWL